VQYLFGDSDIAARRLEVLAEVFAEPTRAFVLEAVAERPRLAVDLGCGPGCSTKFLAGILDFDCIVGLDSSEHFISLAKKNQPEKFSFHLHDVTTVPFPVEPGDMLYCRFLLTHLPDPQAVVAEWAAQLRPKGLLLMEEVEWIRTRNSVFGFYLSIVEDMLTDKSAALYVGPALDRLRSAPGLERRSSKVANLLVPTHHAAAMFYLNIRTWKDQPFVRDNYSVSTIERLEKDLENLAGKSSGEMEIEWGLRQIVFERV